MRRLRRRVRDKKVGAQPQAPGEGRPPFTIPLTLTPKGTPQTPAEGWPPSALLPIFITLQPDWISDILFLLWQVLPKRTRHYRSLYNIRERCSHHFLKLLNAGFSRKVGETFRSKFTSSLLERVLSGKPSRAGEHTWLPICN